MSRRLLPLFVIAGNFAGPMHSPAPAGCRPDSTCPPGHADRGLMAPQRVAASAINATLTVPALRPLRELLLASAAERGHDGCPMA
ncbi:MAG TPA: hypothetical protein VF713_27260 [Thermoanaerobaculia bacterium]